MASLLLIWDESPGTPVTARFDAVPTHTIEGRSEMTQNEVEEGVTVTDHVRPTPRRFSCTGIVTNTPTRSNEDGAISTRVIPTPPSENFDDIEFDLDLPPQPVKFGNLQGAAIGAASDAISGQRIPRRVKLYRTEAFKDRIREMYDALEAARVTAKRIRLEFDIDELDDMCLTFVSRPKTAEDGSKSSFMLEFQQLRVANSETTEAPQPAEPIGAPQQSAGSKSGKEDTKDARKKEALKKSWAAGGFDSLRGALGI